MQLAAARTRLGVRVWAQRLLDIVRGCERSTASHRKPLRCIAARRICTVQRAINRRASRPGRQVSARACAGSPVPMLLDNEAQEQFLRGLKSFADEAREGLDGFPPVSVPVNMSGVDPTSILEAGRQFAAQSWEGLQSSFQSLSLSPDPGAGLGLSWMFYMAYGFLAVVIFTQSPRQ